MNQTIAKKHHNRNDYDNVDYNDDDKNNSKCHNFANNTATKY